MGVNIDIRVDGIKELKFKFENLDKEGRRRVARAINVNAVDYKRAVVKSIRKRTGRYRKYRVGGKNHWSSSPRRAPNSKSGKLAKGIRITTRAKNRSLGAIVVSGASYSAALEFGHRISRRGGRRSNFVTAPSLTQGLSKVAPRPFMFPMLRKKKKEFVARINQAIKGVL